jgi:short-subunit dehydrogenase
MAELTNQVIVITGASRGLGKAIAQQAAEKGAFIVAASRTWEHLCELEKTIREKNGKMLAVQVDVSDASQVKNLFERIDAEFNTIDIVVNVAGIGLFKNVEDLEPLEVAQCINTNLLGTVYSSLEAARRMKLKRAGHIFNVISTAGLKPKMQESVYVASKFGVTGFTASLREELRQFNVKVTSFFPGGMNTPFWDSFRDYRPTTSDFMDVSDVAHLVVELLVAKHSFSVDEVIINRIR